MARSTMQLEADVQAPRVAGRRERGWLSHPAVVQFLRNRAAVASLVVLLALAGVAALAPAIAPENPTQVHIVRRIQSPSLAHPFGTDQFGRDILSRIIWGSRLTFFYAFIAVGIAGAVGVFLGAVAGNAPRWGDAVIMRCMDILLAFPGLLLALVVLTILGTGLVNAEIAVGISLIPVFVRLVRGAILAVREREYVVAARVNGCGPVRLLTRHVLSNVWSQVAILATTALGWSIVIAATLNFLGLGVKPPTPEWGADLAAGRQWLSVAWWVSTAPGISIMIVILATYYLGDGLTEALDPGLRKH